MIKEIKKPFKKLIWINFSWNVQLRQVNYRKIKTPNEQKKNEILK